MLSGETGMAERSQATSRWAALGDNLRGQWWIHVCIAVALLVVFDELSRDVSLLLRGFASNLLVSYCIGAATALVYVLGWAPPPGAGPLRRALAFGLSIVFGVVVGTELALLVLALVLGDFDVDTARMGVWRVGVVITALVVVVSLGYERLRAHVHAVELREQQAQQALLRAQLDSLQARMHPHFLFNALNTVASLIEDEPARAVEAVERLSLLLRHSLEAAPRDRVPLHSELEVVRGYLEIEGLRFGARLRCALATSATIWLSRVSAPTRSAFMTKLRRSSRSSFGLRVAALRNSNAAWRRRRRLSPTPVRCLRPSCRFRHLSSIRPAWSSPPSAIRCRAARTSTRRRCRSRRARMWRASPPPRRTSPRRAPRRPRPSATSSPTR